MKLPKCDKARSKKLTEIYSFTSTKIVMFSLYIAESIYRKVWLTIYFHSRTFHTRYTFCIKKQKKNTEEIMILDLFLSKWWFGYHFLKRKNTSYFFSLFNKINIINPSCQVFLINFFEVLFFAFIFKILPCFPWILK